MKTERMAIELTVYVDVPADITEPEMDQRAAGMRDWLTDELEAGSSVSVDTPYLVWRPAEKHEVATDVLAERTRDAADRYREDTP